MADMSVIQSDEQDEADFPRPTVDLEDNVTPAIAARREKKRLEALAKLEATKKKALEQREQEEVESVEVEAEKVVAQEPSSFVKIVSADGRKLEVSIGNDSWSGVEITVKSELAGEIRRILEEGGFYLKN